MGWIDGLLVNSRDSVLLAEVVRRRPGTVGTVGTLTPHKRKMRGQGTIRTLTPHNLRNMRGQGTIFCESASLFAQKTSFCCCWCVASIRLNGVACVDAEMVRLQQDQQQQQQRR
jgi:hypothetical protein